MMLELFPTKVAIDYLNEEQVLELASNFAAYGDKDWEMVLSDPTIITSKVEKYFGGKYEICDGWIRSGYSSFDLHCDSHYGNQLVCVVQLYGEESSGGDLVLYDPAWRNPQYMNDSNLNPNTVDYTVKFKVGQIILFPANVWHKVTEYKGKVSRITLNLMIRRIS